MRSVIIVLVCVVLFSCGKEKVALETQKNGLAITAIVNSSFSKLNEKQIQN